MKKQSSYDFMMRVITLQAYKAVGLLFVIPRTMEVMWSKHEAQRLGGVSHTGAGQRVDAMEHSEYVRTL